jgi:hypothetical protein
MPKTPRIYERLTRPATSVGSYKSLWFAADHLLLVNSTGYSEDYQRIQFSDIKGFFVIPSDRRLLWHLPWVVFALFSGVFLANTLFSGGKPYVSGAILSFSLIFIAWNHLLGPSCTAFVVTGVQTAQLPSMVRRRKTRKALSRLQPLIAGQQSKLVSPPPIPPSETPPSETPPAETPPAT